MIVRWKKCRNMRSRSTKKGVDFMLSLIVKTILIAKEVQSRQ